MLVGVSAAGRFQTLSPTGGFLDRLHQRRGLTGLKEKEHEHSSHTHPTPPASSANARL
jgi:hypothetical protein